MGGHWASSGRYVGGVFFYRRHPTSGSPLERSEKENKKKTWKTATKSRRRPAATSQRFLPFCFVLFFCFFFQMFRPHGYLVSRTTKTSNLLLCFSFFFSFCCGTFGCEDFGRTHSTASRGRCCWCCCCCNRRMQHHEVTGSSSCRHSAVFCFLLLLLLLLFLFRPFTSFIRLRK